MRSLNHEVHWEVWGVCEGMFSGCETFLCLLPRAPLAEQCYWHNNGGFAVNTNVQKCQSADIYLLSQARHCDCKRWVGGSGCQFIQIRFYVFLSIIYFDGLEFIIGIRKPEKVKWFPNSFCLIFQTLRRCNCVYQSRMPAAMQWLSKGWYYNHSNWHHDDSALSKPRHLGFATSAHSSAPKTIARLLLIKPSGVAYSLMIYSMRLMYSFGL